MHQPVSSSSTTFEFCGLDIIADETNQCYLIEINRLPGLESSNNNLQEENEMYDEMMLSLLHHVALPPVYEMLQIIYDPSSPQITTKQWELVLERQVVERTILNSRRTNNLTPTTKNNMNQNHSQQEQGEILLANLLRWKMYTVKYRRQVLAIHNS
jgi:hypothetical protein